MRATIEAELKANTAKYAPSNAGIVPRIKWVDDDQPRVRRFAFTRRISLLPCVFTEPGISEESARGFGVSWEAYWLIWDIWRTVPGVRKVVVHANELEVTPPIASEWPRIQERIIHALKRNIYPEREVQVINGVNLP
jgi:hypothetical protein